MNSFSQVFEDVQLIKSKVIPSLQQILYYSQVMIGDYKYSTRSNNEIGWILCDGSYLDRVEYNALFQVIGTTFGSTDSTNFRLPDFRGRVPGCAGSGPGLSNRSFGDQVGEERHTLTVNEMPSHNHGGVTGSAGYERSAVQLFSATGSGEAVANDNNTHNHTIPSQGGDQSHENMQPTIFGGYTFIFAGVTQD